MLSLVAGAERFEFLGEVRLDRRFVAVFACFENGPDMVGPFARVDNFRQERLVVAAGGRSGCLHRSL